MRVPFQAPKIVLHSYNRDPKLDPNLDNYPYLDPKEPTCLGFLTMISFKYPKP